MNLLEVIYLGWYWLLDRTIYSMSSKREDEIGPKAHSFFITFLIHGINVWTFIRYTVARHFSLVAPMYLGLSIGLGVFAIGYWAFFRKRANEIVKQEVSTFSALLIVVVSLTYVSVSIYLMIVVGDYVRESATSKR